MMKWSLVLALCGSLLAACNPADFDPGGEPGNDGGGDGGILCGILGDCEGGAGSGSGSAHTNPAASFAAIELGDHAFTDQVALGGSAELAVDADLSTATAVGEGVIVVGSPTAGVFDVAQVTATADLVVDGQHRDAPGGRFVARIAVPTAIAGSVALGYPRGIPISPSYASAYVLEPGRTPAFLTGDTAVIQLVDAGGTNRLVDTSLVAAAPGAVQLGWDRVQMPAEAGDVTLTLTAASFGAPQAVTAAVVDRADRIEATRADDGTVCVHAIAGEREAYTTWTQTIGGTRNPLVANCTSAAAQGTLVVDGAGLELTIDLSTL